MKKKKKKQKPLTKICINVVNHHALIPIFDNNFEGPFATVGCRSLVSPGLCITTEYWKMLRVITTWFMSLIAPCHAAARCASGKMPDNSVARVLESKLPMELMKEEKSVKFKGAGHVFLSLGKAGLGLSLSLKAFWKVLYADPVTRLGVELPGGLRSTGESVKYTAAGCFF